MNTLYWIETFDAIIGAAVTIAGLSFILIIVIIANLEEDILKDKDKKEEVKLLRRLTVFFVTLFIISLSVTIFLPSTKAAYRIIGLGTTIEYLDNNPKAKNIPDNAINAINHLLKEYCNDKNEVKPQREKNDSLYIKRH